MHIKLTEQLPVGDQKPAILNTDGVRCYRAAPQSPNELTLVEFLEGGSIVVTETIWEIWEQVRERKDGTEVL